jgi:hypothetical protein
VRSANSPIVSVSGAAFRDSSRRFLADFVGGGFDVTSPGPVVTPGVGGGFAAPADTAPAGTGFGVGPTPPVATSGGGFAAPPGSYKPQPSTSSSGSSSSAGADDPMRWGLIALGVLVILLGLYEVTR